MQPLPYAGPALPGTCLCGSALPCSYNMPEAPHGPASAIFALLKASTRAGVAEALLQARLTACISC